MMEKLRSEFAIFAKLIVRAIKVTIDLDIAEDMIIMTILRKNEKLLSHFSTNLEDFCKKYREIHKIPEDIRAYTEVTAQPAPNTAISPFFRSQTQNQSQNTAGTQVISPIMTKIDYISNILEICYVNPWAEYIKKYNNNALSLQLRKIIEEEKVERATHDSDMEIDQEDTMNVEKISELIEKKTEKASKTLSADIKSLKNQISQLKLTKKERRGPKGGASNHKQITNGTKKQKRQSPKKTVKFATQKSIKGTKNSQGNRKSALKPTKRKNKTRNSKN